MKRCVICGEEAKFCIKDTSEFYCDECAAAQFEDSSYLQNLNE